MTLLEKYNYEDELQSLRAENMDLRVKLAALNEAHDFGVQRLVTAINCDSVLEIGEELAQNDGNLRALVNTLPQLVWVSGPDGEIKFLNKQWWQYTGLNASQVKNSEWADILHPDDRQLTLQRWQNSLNTGESYEVEYRFKRASDGMYRWFIGQGIPRQDELGKTIEWLGICTDIHEYKVAEAALQQARQRSDELNKAKDQFLAMISHELRTPLSSILGWTQLLQLGKLTEAEQVRAVDAIQENAMTQGQLIEDMLDVSRIMHHKIRINLRPVLANNIVTAAIAMIEPLALEKGIKIELHAANDRLVAYADVNRLQQMIRNLLSNAIKFSYLNGHIRILLTQLDGWVRFRIEDDGIGIHPDFLSHVFECFSQEDRLTSLDHQGLGLGLSIVSNLAELHGGCIQAESKGLGLGASFTILLPAVVDEKSIREASSPCHDGSSQSLLTSDALRGVSCLIVDEDSRSLELLTVALNSYQALVIGVPSVKEGLVMLENLRPDVIVSNLTGTHHDQLIQTVRLKSAEKCDDIPALALIKAENSQECCHALAAGFNRYIVKPIHPEQLAQSVLDLTKTR